MLFAAKKANYFWIICGMNTTLHSAHHGSDPDARELAREVSVMFQCVCLHGLAFECNDTKTCLRMHTHSRRSVHDQQHV